MTRVLVTGSRDWDCPDVVWGRLDRVATEAAQVGERELVVVHGACFPRRDPVMRELPLRSADYLADLWCRRRDHHPLPVRVEQHPANWRTHGRAAGPIRNQAMADLGADACLAFVRGNSPGTTGMIRIAERAGIPVQVVDYADLQPLNTEKHPCLNWQ